MNGAGPFASQDGPGLDADMPDRNRDRVRSDRAGQLPKAAPSGRIKATPPRSLQLPCYDPTMPVARSPADIMCLAVYTLAGGKILRGFMVSTVADRLGVSFEQAEEMAVEAAEAGLIRHEFHTVTLTGEGEARGSILTALVLKKSAGHRRSARRSGPLS